MNTECSNSMSVKWPWCRSKPAICDQSIFWYNSEPARSYHSRLPFRPSRLILSDARMRTCVVPRVSCSLFFYCDLNRSLFPLPVVWHFRSLLKRVCACSTDVCGHLFRVHTQPDHAQSDSGLARPTRTPRGKGPSDGV